MTVSQISCCKRFIPTSESKGTAAGVDVEVSNVSVCCPQCRGYFCGMIAQRGIARRVHTEKAHSAPRPMPASLAIADTRQCSDSVKVRLKRTSARAPCSSRAPPRCSLLLSVDNVHVPA